MADAPGPKVASVKVRVFISRFPSPPPRHVYPANSMAAHLRPILLAEDNPNDVELTLTALHALNLANEIVVWAMRPRRWIFCIAATGFAIVRPPRLPLSCST